MADRHRQPEPVAQLLLEVQLPGPARGSRWSPRRRPGSATRSAPGTPPAPSCSHQRRSPRTANAGVSFEMPTPTWPSFLPQVVDPVRDRSALRLAGEVVARLPLRPPCTSPARPVLKSPINSFFFVSTLMTGSPATLIRFPPDAMYPNCSSPSGSLRTAAAASHSPFSVKPISPSSLWTVQCSIRCPIGPELVPELPRAATYPHPLRSSGRRRSRPRAVAPGRRRCVGFSVLHPNCPPRFRPSRHSGALVTRAA